MKRQTGKTKKSPAKKKIAPIFGVNSSNDGDLPSKMVGSHEIEADSVEGLKEMLQMNSDCTSNYGYHDEYLPMKHGSTHVIQNGPSMYSSRMSSIVPHNYDVVNMRLTQSNNVSHSSLTPLDKIKMKKKIKMKRPKNQHQTLEPQSKYVKIENGEQN